VEPTVVVGSGLLARAFIDGGGETLAGTCFYAAGVSNSGCRDDREFLRERMRLEAAMAARPADERFVYFSTCSVEDPSLRDSPYVRHKIEMEGLARARRRHLVLRLPQVAGKTPNPHTLLNYMHARMARSERFQVWGAATRNVIDIADVARIAMDLIASEDAAAETLNIANPRSYPMLEILASMERVLRRPAVYDVLDKGSAVEIDTTRVAPAIRRCGIAFGDGYLDDIMERYYGDDATR
jgi:nucleoside-diphosphate-sugar epimerase